MTPLLLRGAAADWPAVRSWTLERLAALAPERAVKLVVGNREQGRTRFEPSTLRTWLTDLARERCAGEATRHLKEFDLLASIPALRADLRASTLFPRRSIVATSAWIGGADARTGLHCDHLDNVAVLIAGRKRFLLAPPDVVRPEDISDKYDRWAMLAAVTFEDIAERPCARPRLQVAELAAGDAIYVPAGWWHEVENLDASILMSGFFGSPGRVIGQWSRTGALHAAHVAGLWRRGHCACHMDTRGVA